ncbi:flagellar hook-length control protein FliK [uncultured Brevundimonas sp.]|uniref:flagellar hook-length control protein FliK n=1 Tax=uncultured Brevundimonas sp. TaxID=213418 RepID=UPI0030ECDFC3|tara:strand:+ start:5478 stop:7028 length:1551 start_codon:yes stop_codon:yes gene_type:complete
MSAASLFSIVAPAPAPVAASRAVDAHGDSGFDRMLGEAMDVDTERARSAGKGDSPLTGTGAAPPRPSSGPVTLTEEDTVADVADETALDATPPAPDGAAAAVPPPPVDEVRPPVVAVDKGADGPQVLPGPPPAAVMPQDAPVPQRPPLDGKGTTGPQVLPALDETAPAPVPAQNTRAGAADPRPVLPAMAATAEGPQVLPGVAPVPAAGKSGDRQILPGTDAAAQTGTAAEPATPAVTAAGTRAAAAAMAALAPAVAPPPTRPLADRTGTISNSVRATGERATGAGPSAAAPATGSVTAAAVPPAGATLTAPEATSLSDRPLTQGNAVPVPPVADAPDVTVKSPVDQPPAETPPAPVSQTGTASQTYSLSNLSNAAVEATAQLAAQIIRRLDARSTRFEMALTPDNLGRVDVSLDIDEHGRLAARLAFDNPAAALDMKGRVDELRRQLEAAGFHLADDAFQFAERDRSSGEAFDRRQGRAFAAASRLSDETDAAAPVTAPRWMSLSLTPDRVDMKV